MKNFLFLSFIVLSMFTFSSCKKNSSPESGKVKFFTGDVKVNGVNIKSGQIIKNGDLIETSMQSICDIIFNTRNVIRIFPESKIVLNLGGDSKSANLQAGSIGAVLKNLSKSSDRPFSLSTQTTIAAVRGTSLFAKIEDDGKTYLCDCNGMISLKGKKLPVDKTIDVEATHHRAYRISDKEVTIAEMLYHSDKDMETIAEKIGHKINWDEVDGK